LKLNTKEKRADKTKIIVEKNAINKQDNLSDRNKNIKLGEIKKGEKLLDEISINKKFIMKKIIGK
jgi:hypothetical protein